MSSIIQTKNGPVEVVPNKSGNLSPVNPQPAGQPQPEAPLPRVSPSSSGGGSPTPAPTQNYQGLYNPDKTPQSSNLPQTAVYGLDGNLSGYKDNKTGVVTPVGGVKKNTAANYLGGDSFEAPPSEEENYKKLRDRASELITSVNETYKDESDRANAASAARVNAGGLGGSTAGGEIYQENIRPVVNARNTALAKIYSDIETNATKITADQKLASMNEAKDIVAYQKTLKDDAMKSATTSIAALAANHIDWNAYKTTNPENYQKLVDSVGGDPNVADAMFAMSIPAPEIVSTWNTSNGSGGTTVWQQRVDPVTKQPSIVKYDMPGVPVPGNWTSDKLGTNSQIFKSPDFNSDPTNPKNFMIVSTDPTNGGAITVTKDGKTTINGVPVTDTPGTNSDSSVVGASGTVASVIGLTDPTMPLSAVIEDPSIGIEGVVAGIISNEGGSPKGVVNNPGNIKFVGLPGQTNSGIKATDGGTFASYKTPEAGKQAISDLVNKGAAAGKNFDEFIDAYTGTGSNAPENKSLLSVAGISLPVFNFLTQGVSSMSRLSATQRKQIMNEATAFLNSKGVDVSTFQSEYKAYNDVLASNISRNAKTKIMENELVGTVDNLKSVVNDKELGTVNLDNVAKVWAGQQVNDPLATQYAFHFQQLKNELAAYFAASQGKASPDVIDNQDAADSVKNGMASGSLTGFKNAVENSTSKMRVILQKSVEDAQKAVWDLFGVGDKFQGITTEDTSKNNAEVSDATAGTTGTLGNGTAVTKGPDGKWYDGSGKTYDNDGNPTQ